MSEAPNKVYLQWHCGEHDPDYGNPEPGDVTWSPENIFEDDIEYIRADLVPPIDPDLVDTIRSALEFAEACTRERALLLGGLNGPVEADAALADRYLNAIKAIEGES